VTGLDGDAGPFSLELTTAAPVQLEGGEACDDRTPLAVAPQTGEVRVFGTTLGHADSFDATVFSLADLSGPDTSFGVAVDRAVDLEATLTPFGFPATFFLMSPDCHDGRADEPWAEDLGSGLAWDQIVFSDSLLARIEPGDHTLVVDAADEAGAGDFVLALRLAEEGCLRAPEVTLGVPIAGDTTGQPDRLPADCNGPLPAAPDAVYQLSLEGRQQLVATVSGGAFSPVISLWDACWRDAGPVACVEGDRLEVDRTFSGHGFVVVDAADGGAGPFELLVDAELDARDAACAEAESILEGGGASFVAGSTDGEPARLGAVGCPDVGASAEAPERVYRLEVAVPSLLTVEAEASERPVIVYLLAEPCSDGLEVACGTGATPLEDTPVAPGIYYLIVDGLAAAGPGSFELDVWTTPAP